METAKLPDSRTELDVGSAASHVRGDSDSALLSGEGYDLRFTGMVLGVQHFMRNVRKLEHARKDLRGVDRHRTEKDRLPLCMAFCHIGNDCLELLALGAVDLVIAVDAHHRLVGGDGDDPEFVDVLEFASLGLGRTGHACELRVETEVVLDRDRRERLALLLDLHTFLGLDSLMESVRPAAAREDTSGELVHDVHMVVLHDVIDVALIEAVCAEQLVNHVDALGLLHEVRLNGALAIDALLLRKLSVAVQLAHRTSQIGDHEHLRILRIHLVAAEIRERDFARTLVDREVEFTA